MSLFRYHELIVASRRWRCEPRVRAGVGLLRESDRPCRVIATNLAGEYGVYWAGIDNRSTTGDTFSCLGVPSSTFQELSLGG